MNGPISFTIAQTYGAQYTAQITQQVVATPAQQLVAAQVSGKVNFDGVDLSEVQPLQLYTRSADRIEAATRIATGQHLDIEA